MDRTYFIVFLTAVLIHGSTCDIYFHNPRGSNNRLNENTRPRKNANRLFDSQNNQRGGYNVGEPMYYYAGSKLQIEWTNQHSCADKNSYCELVIQYMCGANLRDGTSTDRIPDNKNSCANKDCNTDPKFGMHEDYDYYYACKMRQRNKGLFTADQNLKNRDTAVNTRQERNGQNNRYGYECTEERDYYPYWHNSPWKDIAVLTNDARRCQYYLQESANVKERWACHFSTEQLETMAGKVTTLPNNKQACETFRYPKDDEDGIKGSWSKFKAHGIAAPECRETQFTRDNHLGNGLDGNPNRYNWTVPELNEDHCALRIRYNISTKDYNGWTVNASYNGAPTKLDLSDKYGFANKTEAKTRGYVYKGDPAVKIFDEGNFDFQLAIDTSQFGRTFQDRTHVFAIKKRTKNLAGTTIHNLNVRGKRGNIVQVYPAVEYDFVPNTLEMNPGEFIHLQWTGADTNPNNNDGQGKKGSDRNNAMLLRRQHYPEGTPGVQYGPAPTYGHYGNNYPLYLNKSTFLGLSQEDLTKLAFLDPGNVGADLNEASPYFDLGPRKVSQLGTYHYVSTRNNDFSNRDQKGRIMVTEMAFTESALGFRGGNLQLPNGLGSVRVDEGAFDSLHLMRMEVWPQAEGQRRVEAEGTGLSAGDEFVSDFLIIYPQTALTNRGKYMTITLRVDPDASNIAVYRTSSDSNFATWTKLDTEVDDNVATFQASSGGVYVAKSHSYTVLIVALTISILVIAMIVIGGVCYFRRNPTKWKYVKHKTTNFKRQFDEKV